MKELEVTMTVRNNRLKERRSKLGMSQKALSDAAGISLASYVALEGIRIAPTTSGRWRKPALMLAEFYCVEPEELFPPTIGAISEPVAVRKVDAVDCGLLLSGYQTRLLEGPDAEHDRAELRMLFDQAATAALSAREAEVLKFRFGFECEALTYEELGEMFGVSRERVRQIETRALGKLRHPRFSRRLRPFIDSGAEAVVGGLVSWS